MAGRHRPQSWIPIAAAILLAGGAAKALEIVPDAPNGSPAGTTIHFSLEGNGIGYEVFALAVGPAEAPSQARLVYDFRTDPVFAWTPTDEGSYAIVGQVRDLSTGGAAERSVTFVVGPRTEAARSQPVVTATEHPLVAYYTAPPCPVGLRMQVGFFAPPAGAVSKTHLKPCVAGRTMNFLVAGMRPQTVYVLRHELVDDAGAVVGQAPARFFETGEVDVEFAVSVVVVPADARASVAERVLLQSPVSPSVGAFPHALDLDGTPLWYSKVKAENGAPAYGLLTRPGGQGTLYSVTDTTLTQWDLLGRIVRETSIARLNEQLTARGLDTINNLHHEVRLLPNGHIGTLATVEKLLVDVQGPGPADVLGDMLLVLDEDLQIAFAWNAFAHLDVTRVGTSGARCPASGIPGCPPILLIEEGHANDWLHTNTITYSPTDGNLLLSVRHQDWLVKIAYEDGAGDGHVVWRLGVDGDFVLDPPDPSAWFSHQHDPNYITPTRLVLYDNNNLQCEGNPGCVSRGQVIELDEENMIATLVTNTPLGQYAEGSGSAQPLENGNLYFDSGFDGPEPGTTSRANELLPGGALVFDLATSIPMYRSHRLTDLYTLPSGWGVSQDAQ